MEQVCLRIHATTAAMIVCACEREWEREYVCMQLHVCAIMNPHDNQHYCRSSAVCAWLVMYERSMSWFVVVHDIIVMVSRITI